MVNRFLAVDLEMANDDLTSVCQVGVAVFENNQLVKTWETLVNPQGGFGFYQTRVHGLTQEDVNHAPKLADVADQLRAMFEGEVVCSYGLSDCQALMDSLPLPSCTWMDASTVARRVWGYGKNKRKLKEVCLENGVELGKAHNALADAVAVGELLCVAMNRDNFSLKQLLGFSQKKIGF